MGKTIRFGLSEVEILSNLPTIGEKDKKNHLGEYGPRTYLFTVKWETTTKKNQQLHA